IYFGLLISAKTETCSNIPLKRTIQTEILNPLAMKLHRIAFTYGMVEEFHSKWIEYFRLYSAFKWDVATCFSFGTY
ncbi:MAG: hypothetical protein L3V56_06965, partial [Candidatus Magnetoovum sp. WYHC-5]|nr:hypothetical protein [Candidatus Magnetoovum sp. WYHC-5]